MSEVVKTPSVLMVGPSLTSRGGMATVEKQLVDCLPREGIDVDFLSTYEDASKLRKAFVAIRAYLAFCRNVDRYDIVHVHMASRASYERKAIFIRHASKRGKRVIIHHHGAEFGTWYDAELNDAKKTEIRDVFARADGVIVLSEEWLDWFTARGFCVDSFIVMHNAVSMPEASCSPGLHQDILFLGRLDERKSPDVLMRAAMKTLEEHPESRLVFGGDGLLERYKALALDLGIDQRCEFLGWTTGEDKEQLFQRAGVYCLPSKNEGMPMSVLEAMAHGIPTVATPVGGVPQIIDDGGNGFIIPVDDEAALSSILCRLADSSELRSMIGNAGRKTVKRGFNIERNVVKLAELYRRLAYSERGVDG